MYYLILGAGRFGRLAIKRLGQHDPAARFQVVDRDPQALAGAGAQNSRVLTTAAEAAAFLAANLTETGSWDWIIPMAPVHLAYAWLRRGPLAGWDWRPRPVAEAVAAAAPWAHKGPEGELYLSYADRLCPDDCPEPDICPVSGAVRGTPLSEVLAALKVPEFEMLVLVSRQLAPGVGGYQPRELWEMARKVRACPRKVLIATACRCHAVVHGLERRG